MQKKTFTLAILTVFFVNGFTQNAIPLIGSKAPSFTLNSTNGEITFPDDFGKSWKILFSHPQDFTPVCTTELLDLARMQNEFKNLNIKIAVISTDNVERHNEWKASLEETNYQGKTTPKIEFPILADTKARISNTYGMVHPLVSSDKDIRGVFIIGPDNTVRAINFYPMQVGRNLNEIVRLVVAMQKVDQEMVYTPANWKNGDDVIVPHFPYTQQQLAENHDIVNDYYNVGNRVWFKKEKKVMDKKEK
jgi:peroxiredoxin (alkyl hydroperoxide reductase subunit C)